MSDAPTPHPPRRVLVTGGCGYLGSRLIADLATDPALPIEEIRVLDNIHRGSVRSLFDLPGGATYRFFEGDLLDPDTTARAVSGVDAVIHLAALVRSPMGYDQPAWVEQVNHWGTVRLIDHCLDAGVARVVHASSTAVYGPGGPFREQDVARPLGHYAQSKLRAEGALEAARGRGLEPVVLRLGSLFGIAPAMRFEAVINHLAYLAGIGRALPVHGSGSQRRPAVHVDDASAAVRWALGRPAGARTFNVAGGNPSVLEVVEAIRAARPEARLRYVEQDVEGHLTMEVDSAAARAAGWEPHITLADGVAGVLDRLGRISAGPESPLGEQ